MSNNYLCSAYIHPSPFQNREDLEFKAMDQGRPLEEVRAHYDFLLTTVK